MSDNTLQIIPGVLEEEWGEIEKKLEKIKTFSKSVHVDIIDGAFASNTTFLDPEPFKPYANDLLLEVHLMVEDPITYLRPFAEAGFKRFIGHVEKMESIPEFVAQGQLLGEIGLALDKQTPVESLGINFDDVDFLTIMTIQAGFSGQKFLPELVDKIKKVRPQTTIPLEVDGGIDAETLPQALSAGATRFVATSFIWDADDPKKQFDALVRLLR